MPQNVMLIVVALLFIWLLILSTFFYILYTHYNNLTKGSTNKSLKSVLEGILLDQKREKEDIAKIVLRCDNIEKESVFHIQKVGLVRFNPFKDTGGDQSFVLALMDANNTGVIISSLYSRSGIRWYTKKIEKGKGVPHELSDEEKKALSMAKGGKE